MKRAFLLAFILFIICMPARALDEYNVHPTGAALQGLRGEIVDCEFYDSYMLLSCPESGVAIMDISDPANPQQIKRLCRYNGSHAIAVYDHYLYVGIGSQHHFAIRIYNINNITDPVLSREIPWTHQLDELEVIGGYLYVSDKYSSHTDVGLSVHDLSDPLNPVEVYHLIEYTITGLDADGDRAVGVGEDDYQILNVSNPDHPVPIGSFPAEGLRRISIQDTLVFSIDTHHVYIRSFTGPGQIHLLSSILLESIIFDVEARGNLMYVSGSSYNPYLRVYYIGDPSNPIQIAALDLRSKDLFVPDNSDVLYTWYSRDWLITLDVSNPQNPQVVNTFGIQDFPICLENCGTVFAIGTDEGGAWIVDWSDPLQPQEAHVLSNNPAEDLAISEAALYVCVDAGSQMGVHVYDIADPVNPALTEEIEFNRPKEIEINDQCLFIYSDSLYATYSLDDPLHPVLIDEFILGESRSRFIVENNILYRICYTYDDDWLFSYYIGIPTAPLRLDAVDIYYNLYFYPTYYDIEFSINNGLIAYVRSDNQDNTVVIIDATDPQNLIRRGRIEFSYPNYPIGCSIFDQMLYVTLNTGKLIVYDVSNLGNPIPIGAIRGLPICRRVVVEDSVGYMLSGTNLVRLDLSELYAEQARLRLNNEVAADENAITQQPDRSAEIFVNPNPFNEQTCLTIHLGAPEILQVTIFDVLGRQVASLHDGPIQAGNHEFTWSPDGLASGVYFLRVQSADGQSAIRKLALVR